jgi:hypothetical protein
VRSGQQNASQLEPNSAPAVAPRLRLQARSAEPQHAAALLLEEELSQFSAAEPAALVR